MIGHGMFCLGRLDRESVLNVRHRVFPKFGLGAIRSGVGSLFVFTLLNECLHCAGWLLLEFGMGFVDNTLGFTVFRFVVEPFLMLGAPPPSLLDTFSVHHFLYLLLTILRTNQNPRPRLRMDSLDPLISGSLFLRLGLMDVLSLKLVNLGF